MHRAAVRGDDRRDDRHALPGSAAGPAAGLVRAPEPLEHLRRLIRQYNRAQNVVFPTGPWHKGGNYGTDVTVPVPQAEQNNPNLPASATETCLSRSA